MIPEVNMRELTTMRCALKLDYYRSPSSRPTLGIESQGKWVHQRKYAINFGTTEIILNLLSGSCCEEATI